MLHVEKSTIMKITLLQQDIVWGDPQANCQKASEFIDRNPGSDIYVLPEMFSTGYATEPEGFADEKGFALSWMKEKARQINAAICGSVAVEEFGRFYNRFYFVRPNGVETLYDKHHLFKYAGENQHFTAGKHRVIFGYAGKLFLPQICYDLRFPCYSRNHKEYDVAIYVASWPSARQHAWDTLLRARAIENQCYVVGVNRVGDDPTCHYNGGSCVIDPWGESIAVCEYGKEDVVTAEIDVDKLHDFRNKFPVLNDQDF